MNSAYRPSEMEENETNQSEEPKKRSTRRSSILKVPKNRNPSEEVDATDTYTFTDFITSKSVRRVSFASSNFVKPFTSDPDKNTIWDTTYEEDVNHTNSTQSSKEQITTASSVLLESNAGIAKQNITNFITSDMDLTRDVSLIDKENIPVLATGIVSIVDFAKKRSATLNSGGNVTRHAVDDGTSRMELTCQPLNVSMCAGDLLSTSDEDEGLEQKTEHESLGQVTINTHEVLPLEECSRNEKCQSIQKKETTFASDVEFTCQISRKELSNSSSYYNPTDKREFSQTMLVEDREFKKNKSANKETTNIIDNSYRNLSLKSGDGMEFTCQLSQQQASNVSQVCHKAIKQEEIVSMLASDMEFTCELPSKRSEDNSQVKNEFGESAVTKDHKIQINVLVDDIKETTLQISNISHRNMTLKCSDDMEFTCQVPRQENCHKNVKQDETVPMLASDMEFTCQIPSKELSQAQFGQSSVIKDRQIQINEPVGALKETTLQIGNISQRNMSLTSCDLMEFTCQVPQRLTSNVSQVCHKNIKQEISMLSSDMELTCQIPKKELSKSDNLLPCHSTFRTRAQSCIKNEFCQDTFNQDHQIEITPQVIENSPRNVSLKSGDGMEFTCQLSQQVVSSDLNRQSLKDIDADLILESDMEFTCQVPKVERTVTGDDFVMENNSITMTKKGASCQTDNNSHMSNRPPVLTDQSFCQKVNSSKPKHQNDSMEFTCQLSQKVESCMDMSYETAAPEIMSPETHNTKSFCTLQGNENSLKIHTNSENDFHTKLCQSDGGRDNSLKLGEPSVLLELSYEEAPSGCSKKKLMSHCNLLEDTILSLKSPTEVRNNASSKLHHDDNQTSKSRQKMDVSVENVHPIHGNTSIVDMEIDDDDVFLPATNLHLIKPHESRDNLINASEEMLDKVSSSAQISVKTKSTVVHTPQKASSKKQKIDEEPPPQNVLFSQKTPFSLSLRRHTSVMKTPDPSFNINLTNISSGIDDTQHLLNCTYAKSHTFNTTKSICLDEKSVADLSVPNMTLELEKTSFSDSLAVPMEGKLASSNDTYFLREMQMEKDAITDADDKDASLGIILDGNLDDGLPTASKQDTLDESVHEPPRKPFKLIEYKLRPSKMPEINQLLKEIEAQRKHITEYLQNFKVREMRIPPELLINERESESFDSLDPSVEEEEAVSESLEEKIRKRQESCQGCWKLETVSANSFCFSTLVGNVEFVVDFSANSSTVSNIETVCKLPEKTRPIGKFVVKYVMDKLSESQIVSAIGRHFDVFSLLDYVQMLLLKIHYFRKEFISTYKFIIMDNLTLQCDLISTRVSLACRVFVNIADVDNLKRDDVKVVHDVGHVNEEHIKDLATECPKGLDFFKSFSHKLRDFLSAKERNVCRLKQQ